MLKVKTTEWHQLELFLPPHTKQLHPCPTSPASCVVIYSSWLLERGRWSLSRITLALVNAWQDSETSHSKSSLGNFQHWYLLDMLVQLSCDSEKCILLLCMWKTGVLKSSHKYWWMTLIRRDFSARILNYMVRYICHFLVGQLTQQLI